MSIVVPAAILEVHFAATAVVRCKLTCAELLNERQFSITMIKRYFIQYSRTTQRTARNIQDAEKFSGDEGV